MSHTLKSMAPTRVRVKNADRGEVEAVFATLKTIDSDGDVILPGSIEDGAQVVVSAYMHESWKGKLPVGRGTIHEEGDELIVRARFFMDTSHGADTFATVKGLAGTDDGDANLGEWSFSLQEIASTKSTWEGKPANVISRIGRIKEVSPVLEGAGVNTRTLIAKSAEDVQAKQLTSSVRRLLSEAGRRRWDYAYPMDFDLDDGYAVFEVSGDDGYHLVQVEFTRTDTSVELGEAETEVHQTSAYLPKSGAKFSEHLTAVVADVKGLTARAEEVMALRAAKGKSLGDDARQLLDELASSLDVVKRIADQPTTNETAIDAEAEYLRFVALTHGVA